MPARMCNTFSLLLVCVLSLLTLARCHDTNITIEVVTTRLRGAATSVASRIHTSSAQTERKNLRGVPAPLPSVILCNGRSVRGPCKRAQDSGAPLPAVILCKGRSVRGPCKSAQESGHMVASVSTTAVPDVTPTTSFLQPHPVDPEAAPVNATVLRQRLRKRQKIKPVVLEATAEPEAAPVNAMASHTLLAFGPTALETEATAGTQQISAKVGARRPEAMLPETVRLSGRMRIDVPDPQEFLADTIARNAVAHGIAHVVGSRPDSISLEASWSGSMLMASPHETARHIDRSVDVDFTVTLQSHQLTPPMALVYTFNSLTQEDISVAIQEELIAAKGPGYAISVIEHEILPVLDPNDV